MYSDLFEMIIGCLELVFKWEIGAHVRSNFFRCNYEPEASELTPIFNNDELTYQFDRTGKVRIIHETNDDGLEITHKFIKLEQSLVIISSFMDVGHENQVIRFINMSRGVHAMWVGEYLYGLNPCEYRINIDGSYEDDGTFYVYLLSMKNGDCLLSCDCNREGDHITIKSSDEDGWDYYGYIRMKLQ